MQYTESLDAWTEKKKLLTLLQKDGYELLTNTQKKKQGNKDMLLELKMIYKGIVEKW